MLKNMKLVLLFAFLASGCTREVYLQKVPCVEGECEPCEEAVVCTDPVPACCPEVAMQTEVVTYQVYDVPAAQVTYVPCPESGRSNCRTVCREQRVR